MPLFPETLHPVESPTLRSNFTLVPTASGASTVGRPDMQSSNEAYTVGRVETGDMQTIPKIDGCDELHTRETSMLAPTASTPVVGAMHEEPKTDDGEENVRTSRIRVKNRRMCYLERHPEYFSSELELGDPLLYDRCIRRFQTPAEREADGKKKGYSGILEADLMRSEAKIAALANPKSATLTYTRGPNGEIYPEDPEDAPKTKEEGLERWKRDMTLRFLRGEDDDFDYNTVDDNEEWDDKTTEEREVQERYFEDEEPSWVLEPSGSAENVAVRGETGVQDF